MFQTQIIKKQLHFKQPAGTSRGVYTTRDVWYILLTDTGSRHYGVGECAPLPALSCDDIPSYDEVLATACKNLEKNGEIDREALLPYPSILFGMETALLHFRARSLQFWHTPFSKGKEGIPINGLIWMGNFDEMYRRIGEKMQQGFRCIKLKIGAIDFEKELELLAHIRRHFTPAQIELRVTVLSLLPMPSKSYIVFPNSSSIPSNSPSVRDNGMKWPDSVPPPPFPLHWMKS